MGDNDLINDFGQTHLLLLADQQWNVIYPFTLDLYFCHSDSSLAVFSFEGKFLSKEKFTYKHINKEAASSGSVPLSPSSTYYAFSIRKSRPRSVNRRTEPAPSLSIHWAKEG
jgi:hypothetical protein